MKRSVFAGATLILLMALAALSAASDLVIIDLHYRTAEELLPVLRPLASDVSLSGSDYKLFVRGDDASVNRIREALAVLDRAPRQLLVSVRYTAIPQSKESAANIAGTISKHSSVAVGGEITNSTASDSSVSSVRVSEGNAAHIATGQSVPVVTGVLVSPTTRRGNALTGMTTDYRELSSGFDVTPRINGERVTLTIATQQQSAALNSENSVQKATTTLSGRLGEWIELGGVANSGNDQHSSFTNGSRSITTKSDQRTIAVKVTTID